jgi:hypothetical protein
MGRHLALLMLSGFQCCVKEQPLNRFEPKTFAYGRSNPSLSIQPPRYQRVDNSTPHTIAMKESLDFRGGPSSHHLHPCPKNNE